MTFEVGDRGFTRNGRPYAIASKGRGLFCLFVDVFNVQEEWKRVSYTEGGKLSEHIVEAAYDLMPREKFVVGDTGKTFGGDDYEVIEVDSGGMRVLITRGLNSTFFEIMCEDGFVWADVAHEGMIDPDNLLDPTGRKLTAPVLTEEEAEMAHALDAFVTSRQELDHAYAILVQTRDNLKVAVDVLNDADRAHDQASFEYEEAVRKFNELIKVP